jgi:hypothetical protein
MASNARDVLLMSSVLNGASAGEVKPILQAGLAQVWKKFEKSLRGLLDHTEQLYKQKVISKTQKLDMSNANAPWLHDGW